MKRISTILIISLLLNLTSYGAVVKDDSRYQQELKNQFVTRAEVEAWQKKMQKWFDFDSHKELMKKVASRSNAHGYYSPNEFDIDDAEWK